MNLSVRSGAAAARVTLCIAMIMCVGGVACGQEQDDYSGVWSGFLLTENRGYSGSGNVLPQQGVADSRFPFTLRIPRGGGPAVLLFEDAVPAKCWPRKCESLTVTLRSDVNDREVQASALQIFFKLPRCGGLGFTLWLRNESASKALFSLHGEASEPLIDGWLAPEGKFRGDRELSFAIPDIIRQ
jgi:hypothetical protein